MFFPNKSVPRSCRGFAVAATRTRNWRWQSCCARMESRDGEGMFKLLVGTPRCGVRARIPGARFRRLYRRRQRSTLSLPCPPSASVRISFFSNCGRRSSWMAVSGTVVQSTAINRRTIGRSGFTNFRATRNVTGSSPAPCGRTAGRWSGFGNTNSRPRTKSACCAGFGRQLSPRRRGSRRTVSCVYAGGQEVEVEECWLVLPHPGLLPKEKEIVLCLTEIRAREYAGRPFSNQKCATAVPSPRGRRSG